MIPRNIDLANCVVILTISTLVRNVSILLLLCSFILLFISYFIVFYFSFSIQPNSCYLVLRLPRAYSQKEE